MKDTIYHIKIKKEYVTAMLEDLQETEAIEIINDDIPEWQKEKVKKRIAAFESDPTSAISKEEFFAALDKDDEI